MTDCGAPGSMDCKEVFKRMQDYLDRELSEVEITEVATHLQMCGHCADEYTFEGSVLRHIRKCCKDIEMPKNLGSIIFEKIRD